MFLGHYGVALAARAVTPRMSLGTTVAASQWLDLIWPVLLLTGLERVRIVPGLMPANSLDFVHYPISHSLLTVLGWGVLGGGLHFLLRRRKRDAGVVGGLIVSHWLLDVPFHRPDLPLWPGSDILVGGGLWASVPLTLALEFGLLGLGLAWYLRRTRARDRVGRWGLWALVGVLSLFYLASFAGPPPDERSLAWGGLALWLFVPWAVWVDRHRTNEARPR